MEECKDTVSKRFDKVYETFKILEASMDMSTEESKKLIDQHIKDFEEMTQIVSELNFFSTNETIDEINPSKLKFLLLPYLLAGLWQMKTGCDRNEICRVVKIYLEDYIERIVDYTIVSKPPAVWFLSKNWSQDPTKNEKTFETPGFQTAEQKRTWKIEQHRINKGMDERIKEFNIRIEKGEEFDDETYKDLYLILIKRAFTDSESKLDNLLRELEMLNYKSQTKQNGNVQSIPSQSMLGPGVPYKTFILTRTEHEKKVFGIGYPAIPAMTVAQLYEQRIKDGTWSKGCEPSSMPPQDEDAEKVSQELSEELDDLNLLNRRREMDEYRDEHRRGWGNRMNRS